MLTEPLRVHVPVHSSVYAIGPSLSDAPIFVGGEEGIRTLDRGLAYTRFPGEPIQPLWHLSNLSAIVSR